MLLWMQHDDGLQEMENVTSKLTHNMIFYIFVCFALDFSAIIDNFLNHSNNQLVFSITTNICLSTCDFGAIKFV